MVKAEPFEGGWRVVDDDGRRWLPDGTFDPMRLAIGGRFVTEAEVMAASWTDRTCFTEREALLLAGVLRDLHIHQQGHEMRMQHAARLPFPDVPLSTEVNAQAESSARIAALEATVLTHKTTIETLNAALELARKEVSKVRVEASAMIANAGVHQVGDLRSAIVHLDKYLRNLGRSVKAPKDPTPAQIVDAWISEYWRVKSSQESIYSDFRTARDTLSQLRQTLVEFGFEAKPGKSTTGIQRKALEELVQTRKIVEKLSAEIRTMGFDPERLIDGEYEVQRAPTP